jgi:hypothetical protein
MHFSAAAGFGISGVESRGPEGACLSPLDALSDERTGLHFVVQSVSGQSRGGLVTIHHCLT